MKIMWITMGNRIPCDNCDHAPVDISIYIAGKGYLELCEACREELRAALEVKSEVKSDVRSAE